MSQPLVKVHVQGQIGSLILNRPDKRNALSRSLVAELQQALGDLHLERRVRAVVLTGAGSAFCAGMDLAEMHATSQESNPQPQWHADAVLYRDLLESMLRFPKPLVAAVNGPAVAGGAGLVLACDLVVASEGASFGLPEPRRGLVAGTIAPLLTFRIGGSQAAYLLLSSKSIDARAAYRLGLFQEITAEDKVWARAAQLGEECAEGAPEALALTKRMLNETIGEHLGTLLSAGAAASATARTTEAAAEGVSAFLEKRRPKWEG
jgi:enoyl-CoA hydratase/carnithine racemase